MRIPRADPAEICGFGIVRGHQAVSFWERVLEETKLVRIFNRERTRGSIKLDNKYEGTTPNGYTPM